MVPTLLAQSLDPCLSLFEADDPLLAECGARVLAGAGRFMMAHARAVGAEMPPLVRRCGAGGGTAGLLG